MASDSASVSIETTTCSQCGWFSIDTDALSEAIASSSASYTELTGRLLDVEIHVEYEGCQAVAELVMEEGYPLMSITSIDRPG